VETFSDANAHTGSIRTLFIDKELDVLYTGSFDKTIKVKRVMWKLKF